MFHNVRRTGIVGSLATRPATRRIIIVVTIALALSVGVFPAQQAGATVAETPVETDSPDHPVGTYGRVNAIAVIGNIAYIGGDFASVGGQTRNNLAAINLTTGNVTNWNPNANGAVNALVASPDGTLVYAGGVFSTIGGDTRRRLAAIRVSNGNATSWNPNPSAEVKAVDVDGNTVFIGGTFQSVGGTNVRNAAAINATTGNADASWNPNPNGSVNALDVAPNGNVVYLGGSFGNVDGANRAHAAAVNAADGNVTSWNPNVGHVVIDLEVGPDSSRIYLAIGGPWAEGGNLSAAYSATNGSTLWSHQSDGDIQAVAIASDRAYFGGHFYLSGGVPFNKLVSYNPVSGERDNNWAPGANSAFGVWELTYADNRLLVGGDFSEIGGVNQPHFAVFEGSGGSNEVPHATFFWNCEGLTCSFDGSNSSDSDGSIVAYDWDFGDGNIASGVSTSHTYAGPGSYVAQLTVTDDDFAQDDTIRTAVTTNQAPNAVFDVTCTYTECTFDGSASSDPDGAVVGYTWDTGDGSTASGWMPSHLFDASGTFAVELTVTDDEGATGSASVDVTVDAAPAHVHDLAPQPDDVDADKWLAVVSIAVRDELNNPVVGAVVDGFFGQGKERTCTTGENGKCKVKVKVGDVKNRIPWEVTSVTWEGGYDPSANHDAVDGDSDGTVILVRQPG